jgi:hypothetical protein
LRDIKINDERVFILTQDGMLQKILPKVFDIETFDLVKMISIEKCALQMKLVSTSSLALVGDRSEILYLYEKRVGRKRMRFI